MKFLSWIFLAVYSISCQAAALPKRIVFLSDFGRKDSAAAICKGVMWKINPDLQISDLTHEIPAFDIEAASQALEDTVPHYPEGTVFVAVVDPGVGGKRRAIAVKTETGYILVGPDNGIFSRVLEIEGEAQAVELKNAQYFRQGYLSSTFHGRDIFSPAAAHLASGVPIEKMGSQAGNLVELPKKQAVLEKGVLEGEIRFIEDPYGNVVSNIPKHLVEQAGFKRGDMLKVRIADKEISLPFQNTFGDVPEGKEVALYHSRNLLSFSVNMGDFAVRHSVKKGQKVSVSKLR